MKAAPLATGSAVAIDRAREKVAARPASTSAVIAAAAGNATAAMSRVDKVTFALPNDVPAQSGVHFLKHQIPRKWLASIVFGGDVFDIDATDIENVDNTEDIADRRIPQSPGDESLSAKESQK